MKKLAYSFLLSAIVLFSTTSCQQVASNKVQHHPNRMLKWLGIGFIAGTVGQLDIGNNQIDLGGNNFQDHNFYLTKSTSPQQRKSQFTSIQISDTFPLNNIGYLVTKRGKHIQACTPTNTTNLLCSEVDKKTLPKLLKKYMETDAGGNYIPWIRDRGKNLYKDILLLVSGLTLANVIGCVEGAFCCRKKRNIDFDMLNLPEPTELVSNHKTEDFLD